jgi:hypothetical protein
MLTLLLALLAALTAFAVQETGDSAVPRKAPPRIRPQQSHRAIVWWQRAEV